MRMMLAASLAALTLGACGQQGGDKTEAPGAQAPAPAPTGTPGAATPANGPTMQSEVRQFRDWHAVCDNGNLCVAYSGSDATSWIRITREPGPTADAPCIGFGLGFVGHDESPGAVTLSADNRRILRTQGVDGLYCADGLAGSPVEGLIAAADANTLTLEGGGQKGVVPASGLKAALLWIDERQGRLNTTTALVRRGTGTAVPPAPALPRVVPAPAISQAGFEGAADPLEGTPRGLKLPAALEALDEVKACRAEGNPTLNQAILAARLDQSTVLWGVPCGSGAYNATYVLYLARPDGSGVRAADLPERTARTEGDIGGQDQWLVNPFYDAERRTLTVFPRGRGLGDCGTITTWTWTTGGFVLSEQRTMADCWGMNADLWPTTWRTRS
ncbi:DUF1176 domain-containing protein [Brevundimonas sp. GCM10030266]|uniref:DUF1176 domain-containing protein n=1 Tax=Brevundimonas sp. GCM10030266 TaxID=3273386 RepID=UPI003610372F